MAAFGGSKADRFLGVFKRLNRFDRGVGAELPQAYKKFWKEWKMTQPAAVHYIPEEGNWKKTNRGVMVPIQNVPIPLKYPKEMDEGIWGGEAVVKGFQKRALKSRRVAHFWTPILKRSVIRSDVLDVYLSVVVTTRTLNLIQDNYGFDHYLLKTPACDLKSLLAIRLKKKILVELQNGCPVYEDNPEKQKEILDQYSKYLTSYTPEEVEWYGLTWQQAVTKYNTAKRILNAPQALKHHYRSQLIEKLKAAGIAEAQDAEVTSGNTWISKMNPFAKKHET